MSEIQTKPRSKSRTLWFNALSIVAMLLTAASQYQVVLDNPIAVGGVAVAISVVNLGLRFVTKTKVE